MESHGLRRTMWWLVTVEAVALLLGAAGKVTPAAGRHNLADVPCGAVASSRRASRIVGGGAAVPGEFPWLVSISRRGGHVCGGSLLARRWVLTAAHCMCSGSTQLGTGGVTVTAGAFDLTATPPSLPVLLLRVHPAFRCARFSHDVALLRLAAPGASWAEGRVAPACLPAPPTHSLYSRFEGRVATAAGWGWLDENSEAGRADVLQKVTLQVVDNVQCRDWYKSQEKKVKILDTQMCAGYEKGGKDSCWADSGGPLMIGEDDHTVVVGVISTGIGCGRYRLPGLYTRLSEYVPWIESILREYSD